MLRSIIAIIVSIFVVASPSNAAFLCFCYGPTQGWADLPIGAGGYLTGQSIASDGTMVVRTDTYGAYIWNATATAPNGATGTWQQLINANSMPAAYIAAAPLYGDGVYEIQAVTISGTTTMYMVYNTVGNGNPPFQAIYKSTNKGVTWTVTGFTPINVQQFFGTDEAGSSIPFKAWGPKLGIDPLNASIVFAGTGNNGMWYTTNGGASWTNIATGTLPFATVDGGGNYPGYSGVIVGRESDQHVFADSYGNGIYYSANQGSSWTKINGSGGQPTHCQTAQIDPSDDYYYCLDDSGDVWQYSTTGAASWSEIYNGGSITGLAVDPSTAHHIVIITNNGQMAESTASSPSFGTFTVSPSTYSETGDIGWMSQFTSPTNGGGPGVIAFDAVTTKTIHAIGNRGAWQTSWSGTLSNSVTLTWNSSGRGIEQLVTTNVIVPATGAPVVSVFDSGIALPVAGFAGYPSSLYPGTPGSGTLVGGWSVDYIGSDVFASIDNSFYGLSPIQDSSYSTNNGTTLTLLPSQALPSNAFPNGGIAGNIVPASASTVIFAPGGNGAGNGEQPSYTTNCCSSSTTWSSVSLTGISTWVNFFIDPYFAGRSVAADRENPGTFYIFYNPNFGIYKWTSSSSSKVADLSGTPSNEFGANAQLKTTPGESFDWWFSAGQNNGAGQIDTGCGSNVLWHYNSSGTSQPTNITNVGCLFAIGFGVNSGGGYPSVYIAGWVNVAGTYTYGIWESDNAGSGCPSNCTATPTWVQKGPWPNNSLDTVRDISGDPGVYGRIYVCFTGSGCDHYNYLLNRDIDPASNDNSPAWLEKAA